MKYSYSFEWRYIRFGVFLSFVFGLFWGFVFFLWLFTDTMWQFFLEAEVLVEENKDSRNTLCIPFSAFDVQNLFSLEICIFTDRSVSWVLTRFLYGNFIGFWVDFSFYDPRWSVKGSTVHELMLLASEHVRIRLWSSMRWSIFLKKIQ